MIKIKRKGLNETTPSKARTWTKWINDCATATTALQQDYQQGKALDFDANLYGRKSIKRLYFFSGKAPFYGKCAYCEAPIKDFQRGDVEHFRPKGKVTDEKDNKINHPGYYWLAYDESNLLPSCLTCNQSSVLDEQPIGKRNRFPVDGDHAQEAAAIADENPLLINPASGDPDDDPALHFNFDEDTGVIGAKTARGKMCIQVFALNKRDQLLEQRLNAAARVDQLVRKMIDKPHMRAKVLRTLAEIRQGQHPYTLAARAAYEKHKPVIEAMLRG